MWAHAHTDLGDLYRGSLTLRQVWVRVSTLPPDAHLWAVLAADAAKSEAADKEAEILSLLAKFQPPKEG